MNGKRRRFIAGAVCPRCGAMDKIVVDLDDDMRACVACDFTEARPAGPDAQPAPRELRTRVNRGKARRVETTAEPVRLLDPQPATPSDLEQ